MLRHSYAEATTCTASLAIYLKACMVQMFKVFITKPCCSQCKKYSHIYKVRFYIYYAAFWFWTLEGENNWGWGEGKGKRRFGGGRYLPYLFIGYLMVSSIWTCLDVGCLLTNICFVFISYISQIRQQYFLYAFCM